METSPLTHSRHDPLLSESERAMLKELSATPQSAARETYAQLVTEERKQPRPDRAGFRARMTLKRAGLTFS